MLDSREGESTARRARAGQQAQIADWEGPLLENTPDGAPDDSRGSDDGDHLPGPDTEAEIP